VKLFKTRMLWKGQVAILGVTAGLLLPMEARAQYAMTVNQETLSPLTAEELNRTAPMLTPAEREALIERYQARREAMDRANNPQSGEPVPAGPAMPNGREAVEVAPAAEGDFHVPPGSSAGAQYLGRNLLNPRANSVLASTLAETSAVNEGPHVFYTGNTHAEFSINGGSTYTDVPIGGGPAAAPNPCCDIDSIYDKGRGVTIWSVLFLNNAASTGVVRIFVRRHIPNANNCAYDYAPGAAVVPDYPHLGLSNDFLYLTTNEGATHRIRRYNLDQLVDCVGVAVTTASVTPAVGQRVVVPVEGATHTMFWAYHDSNTVIRIFYWPETAAGPASATRTITAHNHQNPDCRGGVNNTDWIERSTSYTITGFRMRGAVGGGELGFYWNSSPDVAHSQEHVHAVIVRDDPALAFPILSQPHIFNNGSCIAYPALGVNERGNWGLVVGWGGRAGGGGAAVHPDFSIRDDYSGFSTHVPFATGTHNPAGAPPRWGDYQSVRRHQPCGMAWSATGYAHNGGTGVANINARYIEFMRGRDYQCYVQWRDEIPETP
jgi:hypothetical protein